MGRLKTRHAPKKDNLLGSSYEERKEPIYEPAMMGEDSQCKEINQATAPAQGGTLQGGPSTQSKDSRLNGMVEDIEDEDHNTK